MHGALDLICGWESDSRTENKRKRRAAGFLCEMKRGLEAERAYSEVSQVAEVLGAVYQRLLINNIDRKHVKLNCKNIA